MRTYLGSLEFYRFNHNLYNCGIACGKRVFLSGGPMLVDGWSAKAAPVCGEWKTLYMAVGQYLPGKPGGG
jgi:hypothetical protein